MKFSDREDLLVKLLQLQALDMLRQYDDLHPDGYVERTRSQRGGWLRRVVCMWRWKLAVFARHRRYAQWYIASVRCGE